MSDTLGPIDVEFIINSGEVKRDAERVKKELQSVDQEAEVIGQRVQQRVGKLYDFTNEQALALNSAYQKQSRQQRQSLSEYEQTVRAVSDQYRGLMETGAGAFLELDQETRTLIINLNDAQAELKEVSAAQRDLNKRLQDGDISARQYTNAMGALTIKEAQLRSSIKAMTGELQAQGQAIREKELNMRRLENNVQSLGRNMSSFIFSTQSGLTGLLSSLPNMVQEVQRLQVETQKLNSEGQKTPSILSQIAKGLFSWQTLLMIGISLLISYRKEIESWVRGLFNAEKQLDSTREKHKALVDAFKSDEYKEAITNILQVKEAFKLQERELVTADVALKVYNEKLGNAIGISESLIDAKKRLKESEAAYIEMLLNKIAAEKILEQSADKMVKNMLDQMELTKKLEAAREDLFELQKLQSEGNLTVSQKGMLNTLTKWVEGYENLLDKAKEQAARFTEENNQMASELMAKAAELAAQFSFNLFNFNDDKPKDKAASEYEKLLEKLAQLEQEYARKAMSKDEAELQALRDKFDAIRKEIEKFNADPKNKVKIDLGLLDGIQAGAERNLSYTQETAFLKEVLEARKKMFDEYEAYKLKFGLAKAEERYSGLLKQDQDYAAFLRRMAEENADTYQALLSGTATGAQAERARMLDEAIQAESDRRQRAFEESLAQLQNYEQKRKLLIEQYQEQRIQLQRAGEFEALAELDRKHQRELDKLDDDQVKSMEQYKAFYRGLTGLTQEAATELVKQTRLWLDQLVAAGRISQEMADEIRRKLDAALSQNNRRDIRSIRMQSQAFRELAFSLVELGDSLQHNGLATAGQVLGVLSENMEAFAIATDKEKQIDTADKVAFGLQALARGISILAAATARRRAEEERYFLSLIGLQQQYNLSINEQIRLRSLSNENVFMPDHMGRVKDGLSAAAAAATKYQQAIGKVAQGQAKVDQKNVIDGGATASLALTGAAVGAAFGPLGALIGGGAGLIAGLIGARKPKDVWGPILRTYPKLIQQTAEGVYELDIALAKALISQKLVTDETAASLQEAIEWQAAMESAQKQIEDVVKELAGSLGNDLKNALVEAFTAGEDAALAMGESVEKVLENIIANLLFQQVFKEAFDDLQAQMSKSLAGEGDLFEDFGSFFETAKGLGEQFNEAMKAAQKAAREVGLAIFENERDSSSGLKGAIRRELTEQTASELTGLYRATYDLQRRHFDSHLLLLENERKVLEATVRIMLHSAAIETHTSAMKEELEQAVLELKSIVRNTRPLATNRDLSLSR